LARTGADYLQFPQAYRHTTDAAPGVKMELEDYFRTDARLADNAAAVLSAHAPPTHPRNTDDIINMATASDILTHC